jgi:hypothetical protein
MNKKILIGIALVTVLGCALTVSLVQHLTDSERVNAAAQRIADFDLPQGYQTDYIVDIGDYTIAAYKSADEQSHLAFVELPAGVIPDDDVIEGHVFGGWFNRSQHRATVLRTESRVVRDQPATLTISERRNGEGRHYRSAYLVFEGQDGKAVLVINQPADQWDETAVDAFIASIR